MNWKKRKRLTRLIHKYGLKFHHEYNVMVKEWCVVSAYYGKSRFQLLNEWKQLPHDEWEAKIMEAFNCGDIDEPLEPIYPAFSLEEIESDLRAEYDAEHDKQIDEAFEQEKQDSIRQAIHDAVQKMIDDPTAGLVPSYCVMPPDPFTTALMYEMHNELTKGGTS